MKNRNIHLLLICLITVFMCGCGASSSSEIESNPVAPIESSQVEASSSIEEKAESNSGMKSSLAEQAVETIATATDAPAQTPEEPKDIVKNEDGTYTFSEEFIAKLSEYAYFEEATEEQIINYLNKTFKGTKNLKESDVYTILKLLSEDGLRLVQGKPSDTTEEKKEDVLAENTKSSTSTEPQQPSSSDNYGNNGTVEGSMDHLFDNPDNIGGGERIDTGATLHAGGSSNNSGSTDTGFDSLIQNPDGTMTSPDGSFTFDDPSSFGGGERIDTGATLHAGSSADWDLESAFEGADTTPIGGDGTNIDDTGATIHAGG